MVVKLYGAPLSTCTRRVATILHELQIPFELIYIDVRNGKNKTEVYKKIQPFGMIPYIEDDGFILFESRAIGRYLAAMYPRHDLIPKDPKKNALFEQAAAIEQASFDPSAAKAGWHLYARRLGWGGDQIGIDENLHLLEQRLEGYELMLGKTRYLGGDELTLADLFHLPYAAIIAESSDVFV
ncbi:hypothetical protein HMN09_00251700 [Mycena chlorophos]|uniref:glutathione transferase n=1 Tax=Mycena chlorophos TaxID=658473 RepID=A0A8H6TI39_MYCCL|nr:hypothetical protein HMN09_00251700 [Mycena chlorophos]